MTELTLLLVAGILIAVTATGAYKKRLKNIPFLITARVLIFLAVIFYCLVSDTQFYHLVVAGAVILWIGYDTTLRIMQYKSTH